VFPAHILTDKKTELKYLEKSSDAPILLVLKIPLRCTVNRRLLPFLFLFAKSQKDLRFEMKDNSAFSLLTTDLRMSATLTGSVEEETSVPVLSPSNIDSRSSLNLTEEGIVFLRINSISIGLVHLLNSEVKINDLGFHSLKTIAV